MQALVCSPSQSVARRLAEAKQQIVEEQRRELLGGLMFTCTFRSESDDAQQFTKVFPAAPLVGMPCAGEIGPEHRAGGVHRDSSGASAANATATEAMTTPQPSAP